MKILKIYKENNIEKIIEKINENKMIILPSDTQMAIICKDKNKIFEWKKRNKEKKIIKFIYQYNINNFSSKFVTLADNFWPGALTLIENKQAYRIPNNELLLKILKEIKEIHSSSANISGEEPFKNHLDYLMSIDKKYADEIIIVEGSIEDNIPSTIVDLDKNKILRNGKISEEDILKFIKIN